eukprot:scaffold55382_cov20-Tisochrysis_lutea.AAC.1
MALAYGGGLAAGGDDQEDCGGSTSSLAGLLGGGRHDASPQEPGDSLPALTSFDSGVGEPLQAEQVLSSTKRQRTSGQADPSDRPAASDPHARCHAIGALDDRGWEQDGQQGLGMQQSHCDDDHANDKLEQDEMIVESTADEEQQPAEEGQGARPPPLTTTTMNGILMMDDRLNSIEYKIREMTSMGVQRLDQIKTAFVEEMD